jgi:hypothetical protein
MRILDILHKGAVAVAAKFDDFKNINGLLTTKLTAVESRFSATPVHLQDTKNALNTTVASISSTFLKINKAIDTLNSDTAHLTAESTALLAWLSTHSNQIAILMANEEAHCDQIDQHRQQMVNIEFLLKCTENSIVATIKQNSILTAQMTGLRGTTKAAASAACNDINDLRARMILDLCNAMSTLMSEVKGLHGCLTSLDGIFASQTQTLLDSTPRTCDDKIPDTTCTAALGDTFPPLAPDTPPAMPPTPTPSTKPTDMVPQMTHRSDQSWYQNSTNQCFDNPAGLPRNDRFCKDCTPLAGSNTAAQHNPTSAAYGSFCPARVKH